MTHLLGNKREIDGKKYKAVSSHHTKKRAMEKAKTIRNKGCNVRIIPNKTKKYGKEYYVWKEM